MKSKLFYCVLLILALTILTSCRKSDSKQSLSHISLVNSIDDSQPYWSATSAHNVAKGADGYYFIGKDHFIYYFDSESQEIIALCGKADCNHNNSQCNAFIEPLTYLPSSIYYHNGYLYLLKDVAGNAILEQFNEDGSGRK